MDDVAEAVPATDPRKTDLHMSCRNGHRWHEAWPLPMDVDEFTRRMMAVADCPTCGAPSLLGWPKDKATADV